MDTVQGTSLDAHDNGSAPMATPDVSHDAVYTHKWQAGDIILWDNDSTQHMAVGDYALPQHRLMHRMAICGGEEFGAKVLAG